MKRSKRIYLLLGVLVVLSIATFSVIRLEEHKEQIKNSDKIILDLPSDSVQALSWEYGTQALAFHKDGEQWIYDEDEAFPVDQEKINDLLEPFEEFRASFIIEDVEDYDQYGLKNPICTINITTGDQSYEILVGSYSKMDEKRYVSIGDGNVYLVEDDPINYYNAELKDFIDHDETPMFNNVTKIQFKGAENYTILYEENSTNTYCDDDVYFAQLNGKSLPLDTAKVDSYLKNISYLNLSDYVTYKASDEELEKYGLDDPDLTVSVAYISENENGEEFSDTFVLNISRDPKEKKAAEKAGEKDKNKDMDKEKDKDKESSDDEKITAYLRVGDSKIVYKISADTYKNLMAVSYDSLRHSELFTGDFADVEQIDISLENNDYTITSKKKDGERIYYYQDEKVEIDELKNAVEALKAEEFTDERAKQKEEISLTLHLDNKNFPKVKIQLYRYDGTYCLAVLDGNPVALIKRSYVVDLIEAVHAMVLN